MTDTTQGQDASGDLPDAHELFPDTLPDAEEMFPDRKPNSQQNRFVSPIQDMIFSNPGRSHARVLDAFGYGFKQGWGAAPQEFSEADEALRKAGIYNDYAKGQHNIIKAANEAVMRPAVAALLTVKGALSGAFSGAQAAVAQEGEELGAPNVGRELASLPEAFPAGLHQAAGIPHLPEPIAQAKALDVIGAGEGGYFGTKPVVAETPAAVAEAAKAQDIAKPEGLPGHDAEAGPSPVAQPAAAPAEAAPPAAPDIHTVARQIAPETFSEFDTLSQKKDTFRRWIDELREVRDQTAREGAPHADEIADLQQKLTDATPRLAKKYQARLDPLVAERDAYITEHTQGDSADMAKIRQQLMQADYRQRDLAPDVSKAYRAAEARMPQAEAAETPAAEAVAHEPTSAEAVPAQGAAATEAAVEPVKAGAAPSEAPSANTLIDGSAKASEAAGKQAIAPTEPTQAEPEAKPATLPIAHAPSIVADVSQKLKAAGRPAAEADAAAQIVAAYWETRAQRFEGAKGTAAEMYAHEAPEIKLGKDKAKQAPREMEMAQTATRQGRIRLPDFPFLRDGGGATITLLKKADASTFIHETGHEWLGRMLADADDPAAPAALKTDAQTVLKWLGVDSPDGVKTSHHEKFARGFETYMLEGRAPSSALAKVFAKFKDWLTTIYKTVAALKAPISDDIRGVFDRLLAEKPEKTVIAPERATAGGLGERHEALVEPTAPERAHEVANTLEGERDSHADRTLVKAADHDTRLTDTGAEAEGRAPRGAQPAGDADASGPLGGRSEEPGGTGAFGEGGSEAADQGAGARKKSERLNTAPTPLLRFIASKGGIKASDELITDLRQSLGASNRLIPGFGQLIRIPKQLSSAARKAGRSEAMSIDRAREAAIEAGHLPEGTTVTQFLDAIDNEVRGIGNPMERPHDPAEQAHAEHSFVEGLNDEIKKAGGTELSDAERARALELYHKEGLHDPAAIIERLALEADDAEIASGAPDHLEGIPGWDTVAPGWEFSDDARGASGAGEGAAPASAEQPRGTTARTGGTGARTGGEAAEHPLDATADLPKSETQLIDKAGNIRLDNLGTPEDVSAVIRATAEENSDFIDARRGVLPDAEVLKLADALGMSPEKIADRKLGQAFNAEQIVAARKLLIQSAGNVRDLAAKIAGGTEADVLAYAEARARHLMIQEQVSGITAEAGRALRAFRSLEGSKEAADISAFLKNTQGKTLYQMKEEGALLAMMGTPQQVSKAVHEASLSTYQKVRAGTLSWFINNLISGPITHAGYSVGNTVTQIYKATAETSVAAAYGLIRNLPPEERVHFGEVGAQLYGMVRGMRDGYSPAVTALSTGVPYMKGDIAGMIGQIEAAHRPQAIPGKFGYVMETPSRAVTAIHTMHYSMNYEAEIARRAFRSAIKDGLDPGSTEFNTKVADFTQAPPVAEMEAAHDEAMKMVLMTSPEFGKGTYHLQKWVNSNILAKIVIPFMQVGSNILHAGYIERTPIGVFASQAVRDDLAGRNGEIARATQVSKIAVGVGLSTAIIGLTAENILTGGGPSDPKQLAIKEMTGWRPYSIKVGEAYVPYRKYLGFLGPLIAGVADMYEVGHALSEEGLTKAAASAIFGLAEVIADESWAKGVSNFIDAARHWDRDGGRYLRNLAGSFIPLSVGMQQIATLNDPYRREVRTMLDVARAHIPGMSQGLFPVRDIWGEPILSHTALGASQANHDPATQSLLDAGYYPGRLERKIRGVELNGQQYDDFTRIAGRMARMRVNALVNTPGIAQMPKQIRADKIKDIIESARESARSMILMQNPEIIAKAVDAKKAKLTGAPVH